MLLYPPTHPPVAAVRMHRLTPAVFRMMRKPDVDELRRTQGVRCVQLLAEDACSLIGMNFNSLVRLMGWCSRKVKQQPMGDNNNG